MQEHHPNTPIRSIPIPYQSGLDLSFHFFYGHFLSSQALWSILLFACSGKVAIGILKPIKEITRDPPNSL